MKFKQFESWYRDRLSDGFISYQSAHNCYEIIKDVKSMSLIKRLRYWKNIGMEKALKEMRSPICGRI